MLKKILTAAALALAIGAAYAQNANIPNGGGGSGGTVTLGPGSSVVGKVGIDQTTPGTTNGVVVNNPLSTGTPGTPATDQVVSNQPVNLTVTGNITTQNLNPNSGTATAGSTVALNVYGQSSCTVQVTGTYTGSLSGQSTVDGINWITWGSATAFSKKSSGLMGATITSGAVDIFNFYPQGSTAVRITALGAQTGTAVVTINCSQSPLKDYDVAQGLVADGSQASGNPVQIGGVVRNTAGAANSSGSMGQLAMSPVRQLITKDFSPSETQWAYVAASGGISNTTTAVTMVAAGASGVRNFVTGCQIMSEALGTATELAIRDGAAGTVIWRTKIGTGGITAGENIVFPSPLKGSAATLMEVVTLTASGTGAVYVNCQGFQAQGG